jgi:hypothetical protein
VPDENKSRLGRQLGLGSPGMARRFGDEGAGSSDRLEKARAVLAEASKAVGLPGAFKEAAVHGQAFVPDGRVLKREEVLAPPAEAQQPKGRGRPKAEGERPWEAAGMSRRTWYRRKAGFGQ